VPVTPGVSFKIIESGDQVTHVGIIGRLDTLGVGAIDVSLCAHTAARRCPTIIDLAEVSFLASLGMGMLVRIARGLRSHNAGLVLLNPQEPVERALRAARIDDITPIAHGQDEALRVLQVA
jgi:anti-anti-sigma factor